MQSNHLPDLNSKVYLTIFPWEATLSMLVDINHVIRTAALVLDDILTMRSRADCVNSVLTL
jgi:hypothetical protein